MKPSILALGVVASWVFAACGGSTDLPDEPQPAAASQPAATSQPSGASQPSGGGKQAPLPPQGRAVGEACAAAGQCASGRCSADEQAGGCGVCIEARRLGESCGGALQGCGLSAFCAKGTCVSNKKSAGEPCEPAPKGGDTGECDDELYCSGDWQKGGVCAARIALGGACDYRTLCEAGAICIHDLCRPEASLYAGQGESCADGYCQDGLLCDPEALVCKPGSLKEGALCGIVSGEIVHDECASGLTCYDLKWPNGGGGQETVSRCHPLPEAGEFCAYGRCAPGLTCDGHASFNVVSPVCVRLRLEGEDCHEYGPDCVAGLECRAGACRAACQ